MKTMVYVLLEYDWEDKEQIVEVTLSKEKALNWQRGDPYHDYKELEFNDEI